MPELSFATMQMHKCVDGLRAGDPAAADELFRAAEGRLERLARKMLRGFPGVRGRADTGDVLNNACMRLLKALHDIQPDSTRAFFALSALQIRRELLDLARAEAKKKVEPVDVVRLPGPADPDLELWSHFHEAVEGLPSDEREVVSLVYYHGWTQPQIAELLGVSERTVRRYWVAASRRLHSTLKGQFPRPVR
ncbi:MAG: sigma-70 family RNA polymerase sigma factor [Gemmataceae bacterium]